MGEDYCPSRNSDPQPLDPESGVRATGPRCLRLLPNPHLHHHPNPTLRVLLCTRLVSRTFRNQFPPYFSVLQSSGIWRTPGLSIPWCCLPTSSSVCLVFFLLSLWLRRWFWSDLMNGRHDHTTAVCVSLGWSDCLLEEGTELEVD